MRIFNIFKSKKEKSILLRLDSLESKNRFGLYQESQSSGSTIYEVEEIETFMHKSKISVLDLHTWDDYKTNDKETKRELKLKVNNGWFDTNNIYWGEKTEVPKGRYGMYVEYISSGHITYMLEQTHAFKNLSKMRVKDIHIYSSYKKNSDETKKEFILKANGAWFLTSQIQWDIPKERDKKLEEILQ